MTINIIYHNTNNNQYGINIQDFSNNEVVYFNRESASFVHIPNSLYRRNYSQRPIYDNELKDWITFINTNKYKYGQLGYNQCYQVLVNLINTLTLYPRNQKTITNRVIIKNDEICPICLSDYTIGDEMIKFHTSNYTQRGHLSCSECFSKYVSNKCPICRGLID